MVREICFFAGKHLGHGRQAPRQTARVLAKASLVKISGSGRIGVHAVAGQCLTVGLPDSSLTGEDS